MKNVFILTDVGSKSTGAALKEYALKNKPDINFIILPEDELVGSVRYFFTERYLNGAEGIKKIVSRFDEYKMDDFLPESPEFKENNPSYKKLAMFFEKYQPVAVIVLSPRLLAVSLAVKQRMKSEAKIFVVCDEFVLDKRYAHKKVDYYIVDNDEEKGFLLENGIPEEIISVTNIPIKAEYEELNPSREAAAEALKLPDKKTLLLVVGMDGEERFKRLIKELADKALDLNVIVACGYDRRLLEYVQENTSFTYYNEGMSLNIPYSLADLVVARPTAIVLSEVLFKGKALITVFPQGEIERRAQKYVGERYSYAVEGTEDASRLISEFFDGKLDFSEKNENAFTHFIAGSAGRIVEKLFS